MEATCAEEVKTRRSGNLRRPLSTAQRFTCTGPSINTEQHCELLGFLPQNYQYHVCRYRAVSQSEADHVSFEATVRMSLRSKEEIQVWLRSMAVTWRVAHTRPTKGRRIIFKADYRCQYNTKPRDKLTRATKNTDCPAKLKVTLVRTEASRGQRSRNTDPHIPEYPTLVHISNIHNHSVRMASSGMTTTAADAPQDVFDRKEWSSMIGEFSAVAQSSAGFQRAAVAMMKTFHALKGNPSMLQSAMHMFGHNGANGLASRTPPRSGPPSSMFPRKVKLDGRRKPTARTLDSQSSSSTVDVFCSEQT
ncbi:uncharacterized protein si:dkey-75a21.2 isoform X1 [Hippoglossus stenolepis]|uniref:uncharacterized protein si:dkey-75a21.2 isoform X1 n=1 Tax=Hippoglossus stenolepis TaxID=195615 RepID=UPI00159CC1CB|nr:uncharacterized protein si:dkey-75a21.2 isoform X1 [Hippoglossus stenolepis]